MEKSSSRFAGLRTGLLAILGFLLLAGCVSGLVVLLKVSVWTLPVTALLALLPALIVTAVAERFRKDPAAFSLRRLFAGLALGFWCLECLLLGAPVHYMAYAVEKKPLMMPRVELTDGTRKVVFQGMIHVASDAFYRSVVADTEAALSRGYKIYSEGVRHDSDEGDRWLSDFLGTKDLSGFYDDFARVAGLKFQKDYFGFLDRDAETPPGRHVTADVSVSEMKREHDRLMLTDPAYAQKNRVHESSPERGESMTRLKSLFARIQTLDASRRDLIGIGLRWVINRTLDDPESKLPGREVIVDYRNRRLVDRILEDTADKIYITYGAGHLPGVIAELRRRNPAWTAVTTGYTRAIAAPEGR